MKRNDLIAVCRYYKGEQANPYKWDTENNANQWWEHERMYCIKYNHGTFGDLTPKAALVYFLDLLFTHLADQYQTTEEHFRKKYYNL